MTVSYTSEVATCQGFSCFLRLLARWRGSIYKLLWRDLIAFIMIYYAFNVAYRLFVYHDLQDLKNTFESIAKYSKECGRYIPLSFVLGFYVSIVMTRWWNQYASIPHPDSIAVYVSATIHGQDERGRVMRRTIMRYVCLAITMLFTNIATKVKKRFPTLESFVIAGLLEPSEADVVSKLNEKFPFYSKHWLPLVWATSIITRARQEGRIRDDFAVKTMLDEINAIRTRCAVLTHYDRISIPLVYTQVVTLAVYSYFFATLMGDQYINSRHDTNTEFRLCPFPIFTVLQFFFYMGWLKVAESLINPFGDDDDDFELNWMVDRNLKTSYLIVDEMHHEHPELIKDHYWLEVFPRDLPYPEDLDESVPLRESEPLPSTVNIARACEDYNPMLGSKFGSQFSIASSVQSYITKSNPLALYLKKKFMRQSSNESSFGGSQDFVHMNKPKLKLFEEVIKEVDEQLTIMSRRDEPLRPTVLEMFGHQGTRQFQSRFSVARTETNSIRTESRNNLDVEKNDSSDPGSETDDCFTELRDKRLAEREKILTRNFVRYSSVRKKL